MHKRLRRELDEWPIRFPGAQVDEEDGRAVLVFREGRLVLPPAYPFKPPEVVTRTPLLSALHPETWALVLLMQPDLRARFPTWRIPCFCCESVGCANKWHVGRRLVEGWQELRFAHLYTRLRTTRLPVELPNDILEHMVSQANNGCLTKTSCIAG